MAEKKADPIAVLLSLPHGSAIWDRVSRDGKNWEVALLIREETRLVKGLPKGCQVEFRMGAIAINGVILIPWMVKVGSLAPYEAWINACVTGRASPLAELIEQPVVSVLLFDKDNKPIRAIQSPNALDWGGVAQVVQAAKPWAMRAFDAARDEFLAGFKTVQNLWDHLGNAGG